MGGLPRVSLTLLSGVFVRVEASGLRREGQPMALYSDPLPPPTGGGGGRGAGWGGVARAASAGSGAPRSPRPLGLRKRPPPPTPPHHSLRSRKEGSALC